LLAGLPVQPRRSNKTVEELTQLRTATTMASLRLPVSFLLLVAARGSEMPQYTMVHKESDFKVWQYHDS
jgi:hypothetical protein